MNTDHSHALPFPSKDAGPACLARADCENGRQTLTDFCEAFHEPVVAYLKCLLRDGNAARSMRREFFTEALSGYTLDAADSVHWRFCSYVLGVVKYFSQRQM